MVEIQINDVIETNAKLTDELDRNEVCKHMKVSEQIEGFDDVRDDADGTEIEPENGDVAMQDVTDCMKTHRATLYEKNVTSGGSIYWEPHVDGIPIPVEGTWYDTVDEAFEMYSKYAEMAGFEVKRSGQRLTMKVCGYCQEKTNEHTKITCPNNPKARKKKKATPIMDV